jgi:hypothetical protein
MNYLTFKKIDNLDHKLLSFLRIIEVGSKIIPINNYPDFDFSNYQGLTEQTYFFKDSWSFDGEFGAVIDVSIENQCVFHVDDIKRLAEEYNVYFDSSNPCDVLNEIRGNNKDLMLDEGIPPDFDGFKLNDIRVEKIDHSEKVVHFFGSYDGDSYSIDPMDWNIFIECSFYSFVSSDTFGKFYVDLISESYSLRDDGNMKLSYFLMYTAFENYINERLNSQDREGRLKDKLNELFKMQFSSLGNHQVYTSVVGDFDRWETIRNEIAHGKANIKITSEIVDGLTIFSLALITSLESGESQFELLSRKINTQ